MTERAIRILEYKKIIEELMEQAGSEITRENISRLMPLKDEKKIRYGLQ